MNYLFLYTELAGYIVNCFEIHLKLNPDDEIHVVHYPVNPEAPFDLSQFKGVKLYNLETIGMEGVYELINTLNAEVIFVSGWSEKIYTRIARYFKGTKKFVLCFDNIWKGNFRQRLLLPFGRIFMKPLFQIAWVPGEPQAKFAKKLGFEQQNIFTGFYATDIGMFRNFALESQKAIGLVRPKRFLCVARYIPEKGLDILWQAFLKLKEESNTDWELWCVGAGELYDQRVQSPFINHLGFVQPKEMGRIIAETDVFVLPSVSEPWGMVVQEFSAAQMPLLLSSAVGAGSVFLQEGRNGYRFRAGDVNDLIRVMKLIIAKSNTELEEMGNRSAINAEKNDSHKWSDTLKLISTI